VIHLRLLLWLWILLVPGRAAAEVAAHASTGDVKLEPRLGERVPRDVSLRDLDRGALASGELFRTGRPVVLVLAYSDCPMLCSLVLRGLADAARRAERRPGRDYDLVTVSIDPREPVDVARRSRSRLAALAGESEVERWRYLLGAEPDVRRLADALGFGYHYDTTTGQYAHPAAVFVLSADGTIARVLDELEHAPGALDEALEAATAGDIAEASALDAILRCFRFDPAGRRHGAAITWGLRGLGLLLLASLAAALLFHRRRRA
jgi:protein SCO1